MRKILGLDLGTTSIGWALIHEAEEGTDEFSSIIKTGVRVVPLSTDDQQDFKKGRSITINADRTLKRGMRRSLHRYKQRRGAVIKILKKIRFIDDDTTFSEEGKNTTYSTYALRAKAPLEKISKEDFARVLLMINKKRGYKSSRKANSSEEGQLIDGMAVAKELYNKNLTPGQFSYQLLKEGKKMLPDYYRSDLQDEFNRIWEFQKQFYPDKLTSGDKTALLERNKRDTSGYFENTMHIDRAENKSKDKKLQYYEWRNKAVNEKLELAEIAYVLTELNNQINQSSGYLGAISDRSKELYFNNLTVGQYQYRQLKENPHARLKNQVFYRQDYQDEFDAIWKEQSKHYPELTEEVRLELRDITIFYQRRLKSQKGLINICEFEGVEREITINGKKKKQHIGPRVAPKSSPVFQQFKIWQQINDIKVTQKDRSKEEYPLEEATKKLLFEELNLVEKMTEKAFLTWLFKDSDENPAAWKLNFRHLEGNRTNAALMEVFRKITVLEGYDNIKYNKLSASEIVKTMQACFREVGIDPGVLTFDASIPGNEWVKQPLYQLWHLLYSYEDDSSKTGTESLLEKLQTNFDFKEEHTRLLSNVTFKQDYGNVSAKAIRKILPHLEDGLMYDEACSQAGYNHSNSITKEENDVRGLKDSIEILKKNSLRNPVVEKILNQTINVVNAIIADPKLGRPDEIRIELARDLKKTAEQRNKLTKTIAKTTKDHEEYRKILKEEFGLSYVSRNDLIKYKLYLELKATGYKTLYSGTYIPPGELFTKKFDIEHIIPQARLFDDSFSNKTLELRAVNLEKGDETAFDYCERKDWLNDFKSRVAEVFAAKNGIRYMKRKKLFMRNEDIPEGFLNRDLGISAYIARKASELLKQVCKTITLTTGSITARLREDWELINVLQELNWDKYDVQGLTYFQENRHRQKLARIKDWTKRNDHRHHAMDALTVAFTKPAHIQYLNNLNAKSNSNIILQNIEQKYTYRDEKGTRKFYKPFENIREESKKHLAAILISHKAKNKVVTQNKNKIKIKGKGKFKTKTELTPRGQLHKETIYGKSKHPVVKEEKIGSAFTIEKIATVTKKTYRDVLLKRLAEFNNDPKKAFTGKNSLAKNPVYLTDDKTTLPEKVKTVTLEEQFTIRKELAPGIKIEKVTDEGVKKILQQRLEAFNGDPKKAFSNLDENPVWLNEDKKIPVKRITISGVSNAEPLHTTKDHNGHEILDKKGNAIPVDYISTGNNHHVAIYRDKGGKLQEKVVSFYDAVVSVNEGLPVIDKMFNNHLGWQFLFTMKQNEMFVFPNEDFNPSEIDLLDKENANLISKHLFRVQKIATKNYFFRHHLETTVEEIKELKSITYKPQLGLSGIEGIIKVRLNHLGDIVQTGEY